MCVIFSQNSLIYCFPIILTLNFCSGSSSRKCRSKYGPPKNSDESSDPSSEESLFQPSQSDKLCNVAPAQSGKPCHTKSSHLSNLPPANEVITILDSSTPSPSHSPNVLEDVENTFSQEQGVASRFREVPPAKGIFALPVVSTAIPIPEETTDSLTHDMILDITKAHYSNQPGNVIESRYNWENTYSHHSCSMVPGDFSCCKLISMCVKQFINFIFFVVTSPIICLFSVLYFQMKATSLMTIAFLHRTPFVLQ